MVSLSNGVLSYGNSSKRPLENGHISSSAGVLTRKYKARKVSAVRDFPPFCGPNAPPAATVSLEATDGDVADSVQPSDIKSELQTNVVSELQTNDVSMGDLVKEVVVTDGTVDGVKDEKLSPDLKPHEIISPKAISKDPNQSKCQGFVKEEEPPEVENKASEEKKTVLEVDTVANYVVPIGSEKSIGDGIVGERTVSSPKNKYRRRRVSAIRDFPPFCGWNVRLPTDEEGLRIAGDKSLVVKENAGGTSKASAQASEDVLRVGHEAAATRYIERGGDEEVKGGVMDSNFVKSVLKGVPGSRNKNQAVVKRKIADAKSSGKVGKEIVVYEREKSLKGKPSVDDVGLGQEVDRVVVQGMMAAPNCPWRQGKGMLASLDDGSSVSRAKKRDFTGQQKVKLVSRKNHLADHSGGKSKKKKPVSAGSASCESSSAIVGGDMDDYVGANEEKHQNILTGQTTLDVDVCLPPFGPSSSSSHGDARNKVRETLRLFQGLCRKLLQGEEAKSRQGEETSSKKRRIDLDAANIIKEKKKEVNADSKIVGAVPGVEVGDEFQYRVEIAIVGIHRLYQGGIDYIKKGKDIIAISIVASGAYADDMENADILTYSGQGGNLIGKNKQPEDQKLERGNLALKNSISVKNPVRVVRGYKDPKPSDSPDGRPRIITTYYYDGLYTVESYRTEIGSHGKLVFMFELRRIPGQPELAWRKVKNSKKSKKREGLCVGDISGGKEMVPIGAVNTVDDENPPPFTYITRRIYPDWYIPVPSKGCDCIGRCSDSRKCSCAVKNGGEIPYNRNGAIVEAKPLVFECGPSCKCPPSCYNRVTQHGIKIHLEIFKTESRGWGVRSLNSIPSGTFICEYVGELLEDKEAEQRIGNDEYLFDIGQNYNDCSIKPEMKSDFSELMEDGGYTIDAAQHGNVGRFINHSCSPNLYAQNVLYDHEDKRIPHIMLFAAENIPPLQELTYHYNYSLDEVRDSSGNIKMKSCYCGSTDCTGRMY